MLVARETTSIKLDKEIKEEAKKIFNELGMTMGDAVNIFLKQVLLHNGLPFEVKIPNEKTKKIIEEAKIDINMLDSSIEEMLQEREAWKNAKN